MPNLPSILIDFLQKQNISFHAISALIVEHEAAEYSGLNFILNESTYTYRTVKCTPKKAGFFVTFWRRNEDRITEPFSEFNTTDFLLLGVDYEGEKGYFLFDRTTLLNYGIITSTKHPGKRGFRVYTPQSKVSKATAIKTQKWQCKSYFSI